MQERHQQANEARRTRTARRPHDDSRNHQNERSRQSDHEICRIRGPLDDNSMYVAGMNTGKDGPKNHHLLQTKGQDPHKKSIHELPSSWMSLPSKESLPPLQQSSECRDPCSTNESCCKEAPSSSSDERNDLAGFVCGRLQCTDLEKEGDAIDYLFEYVESLLCRDPPSDSFQQWDNDVLYADDSSIISYISPSVNSYFLKSQRSALSGRDDSSLEGLTFSRRNANGSSKGNSKEKNMRSSIVKSSRGITSRYEANENNMEIIYNLREERPRVEKPKQKKRKKRFRGSKVRYEAREIGMEVVYHPRERPQVEEPKQKKRFWSLLVAKKR